MNKYESVIIINPNCTEEAIYMLINFEAKPDSIAELERNYRITDEILKFIVVRKEN